MLLENFNIDFVNFKTKEFASIDVIEDKSHLSLADLSRLEDIFNQPDRHKMFEPKFKDKYFAKENVINFIDWSKRNKDYFLFLIRDCRSEIVGGVDLQIEGKERASIGFWQDEKSSGYITSGLLCLLPLINNSGFTIIDSYTEPTNVKAISVLSRLGFVKGGIVDGKTKGKLLRFIKL